MAGLYSYPGFIGDIIRGDTRVFQITIKRNGTAVDITGSKFYLTIATDLDPSITPVLEILIDPPTDPLNGITDGEITDTQTSALAAGKYYYSLRFINSLGQAFVIDLGTINVYNGVSERIE